MKLRSDRLDAFQGKLVALVRSAKRSAAVGPRVLDALETACAVLFAIGCAHLLGQRNVGWAAFSAYMVMRPQLAQTTRRGALRIIGTIAGAALACLVPASWMSSLPGAALVLAVSGGLSLYLALTRRHGYAWLVVGLTFTMVAVDLMAGADASLFAISRVGEVVTGTCCALAVSTLSLLLVRRRLGGSYLADAPLPPPLAPSAWQPAALRHALKAALALALVPFAARTIILPEAVQAGVTILVVLMIPLRDLDTAHGHAIRRLLHRVAGCLTGGALAAALLHAFHPWPVAVALSIAAGVAAGRIIESAPTAMTYVGAQFALAFLVVLVPDAYDTVDLEGGIDRFFGVLWGMALLYPVLLLAQLSAWPLRRGVRPDAND